MTDRFVILFRVEEAHLPYGKGCDGQPRPDFLAQTLDWLDSSAFASWRLLEPTLAAQLLRSMDKTLRSLAQAYMRADSIAVSLLNLVENEVIQCSAEQELLGLLRTRASFATLCPVCNKG